jgi:hypothetical protein
MGRLEHSTGRRGREMEAVRIVDFQGCPVENLLTTQSARIEIKFVVFQGGKYLQPNFLLKDGSGNALFSSTHNPALRRIPLDEGKYKSSMLIPADFLAPGTISISIGIEQIAGWPGKTGACN